MKKLIISIFITLLAFYNLKAQGLYNKGAKIVITSGTYMNITGGSNGNLINDDDGSNIGEIDLDGTLIIEGDLTNNSTSNVFTNVEATPDGTVIFPSGTHTITANITDADGIITNYVNFEKVDIQSSSVVNVPSGSGITVNGTLNIDGDLHLLEGSDPEDPIGSFILYQTSYTGSGSIHLHKTFKVGNRWQYVSMPVSDATDDIFDHSPASGNFNPNLYWYQESYDANPDPPNTDYDNWQSTAYELYYAWYNEQVADQSASNPLEVGKGYITLNETNVSNEFVANSSTLNISDSYDLSSYMSFTPNDGNGDYYDGWNLLGNPYQSAIDWEALTRNNIQSTVYIWDGDAGNYVYYTIDGDYSQGTGQTLNADNNARYIPAFQAFFVKATASSPSLTIPKTAAIHVANPMYKKGETNSKKPLYSFFKLRVEYENMSDETMIRFMDNSSWDNDELDAPKAFALWNSVPQIYSTTTTFPTAIPYAFNSIPNDPDLDYVSIPLGVVAKENGEYTISLADYNNFDFDKVILVDKTENNTQYIDLLLNPEYTVYLPAGEYRGRFFLLGIYSGSNSDPTEDQDGDVADVLYNNGSSVSIYSNANSVYLSIPNVEELNGNVEIYDQLGKLVYRGVANSTLTQINLHLEAGNYIVKYYSPKQIYTEKVFISF